MDENEDCHNIEGESQRLITYYHRKRISTSTTATTASCGSPVPCHRRHRVVLNISGARYETYRRTLKRFPDTLLSSLNTRSPYYCLKSGQYFFDRNRRCFEAILFFYQSNGILKRPTDVSFPVFFDECRFFHLPEYFIARMELENGIIPELWKPENRAPPGETFCERMWNILDAPETGYAAMVFGVVSLLAILISTVLSVVSSAVVEEEHGKMSKLDISELAVNTWFVLEISLRFIFCPSKLRFFLSFMNCIDIIAVLPPLVFFFLESTGTNGGYENKLQFLRTVRLLRVVRLMRLSKQSKRLQVVVQAIKQCAADWQMMLMCLLMAMLLGSSIIYFIEERSSESQFTSIPEGIYWAIVTATSVGYGDIVPVTVMGQLFTAAFLVVTILTVTCPIHSLVNSFVDMYNTNIDGARDL